MATLTLLNPLDKFSSYSVHYIMLACRTTSEAQDFTNKDNERATLDAIQKVERLGDAVPYGKKDTAFLVMDTRRFSQFSIDNLKYDVLINGLTKGNAHSNVTTEVEMLITDVVGISFINFIQWLMNEKMQTNFDGMIFMLRVIFVGHTATNALTATASQSETVQTVTIPMMLTKLELNLDYAKGAYTATFMPNVNFDVKQHSRWLNISRASQYFTGAGNNKLGAVIDSFQKSLNEASFSYYNKAASMLKEAGRKTTSDGKFGRQVQYQITLPKGWADFEFLGRGTNNASETIHKQLLQAENKDKKPPAANAKPLDSHMSVEAGMQITAVLDLMFKQVPQIAELGGKGKMVPGTGGSVTFYKHLVGISSNDESFIVHVDVLEFRVPNIVVADQKAGAGVSKEDSLFQSGFPDGIRRPKDYMEFDYIFTGKNKDILAFDMKIQDLQILLASNLEMGFGAMQGISNDPNASADQKLLKASELLNARAYDPILLPKTTADEYQNFNQFSRMIKDKEAAKQTQDYTRNLSMFYAASPVTTVITIRGNPLIMAKFTYENFLEHVGGITNTGTGASNLNTGTVADYRQKLEEKIINDNTKTTASGKQEELRIEGGTIVVNSLGRSSYVHTPVFVKINVKGPNIDAVTGQMVEGQDFAKEILQDNYYTVFQVTNKIEGSNFTQDIVLYSQNVFGDAKIANTQDKTMKTA